MLVDSVSGSSVQLKPSILGVQGKIYSVSKCRLVGAKVGECVQAHVATARLIVVVYSERHAPARQYAEARH